MWLLFGARACWTEWTCIQCNYYSNNYIFIFCEVHVAYYGDCCLCQMYWYCEIDFLLLIFDIGSFDYLEPIPLNIENEVTLVKFRISSYFAQITSIVSCLRKCQSKVLKRFSFFEIDKSSKIAILATSFPGLLGKSPGNEVGHFSFQSPPKMAE